jgi:hypothetical protein
MEDDRQKRGGCAVIAGIGLAMLPVLYLFGAGPAFWLSIHGFISESLVNGFYYPLEYLGQRSPAFHDCLAWYLALWAF